jgi:hypothetical protein
MDVRWLITADDHVGRGEGAACLTPRWPPLAPLLDLCGLVAARVIDQDGLYNPSRSNKARRINVHLDAHRVGG